MYTSIERQYRENARQESGYLKPEICVDDVFRKVFETKGYKVSDQEILYLCESFRKISLISIRLFPDTVTCLDGLRKAGKRYGLDKSQTIMIGNEIQSDMVGAKAAGIAGFYINRAPVFHREAAPIYQYVSENGSLLEVLTQTGIL